MSALKRHWFFALLMLTTHLSDLSWLWFGMETPPQPSPAAPCTYLYSLSGLEFWEVFMAAETV